MKAVFAAILAGVLWSGPVYGQDSGRIPDWIENLGRDQIDIRTTAETRLLKAGRAAWGPLTKAKDHPDPEISARASQILLHASLRRKISYRILRYHPNAIHTLQDGPTREKLRLISTLGRYSKESKAFLVAFSADPDPQIAIAAAEALYENRDFSWVTHLLRIYANETVPRSPQVSRLLVAASSRIPPETIQDLFPKASLEGKSRLINLANTADIRLEIPPEILHQMMGPENPYTQKVALRWIRNHPSPRETAYAATLTNSPSPGVVTEALLTVRILRYPVSLEAILPLASHESPEVREEALRLLHLIDESSAALIAEEKINDPSTSVRKVALEHLWKIRGNTILPLVIRIYLEEGSEHADLAATYLIQNWDWAEPRLERAVKSKSVAVRLRALRLLYRITGNSVLTRAMKDREEGIRLWALRRILSRNHPSTVTTLEKLTTDRSSNIRFEAIRGLVRRGKRERLKDLVPFLESEDYLHQVEAAETLFDYSREQILSLANTILKGKDPYLKRMALDALSSRQVFEATSLALPCLFSEDPRLRRSTARYLSQALSHRPSTHVTTHLREKLPTLKGERFTLSFQLLISHGDEACRPVILEALRSGKGTNHYNTLRALCAWAGPAARIDLIGLLGGNPLLNQGIFRQLKKIKPEEEAPFIAAMDRLLKHRDHAVRSAAIPAAIDLSPEILKRNLAALLRDGAPEVRFEAILASRKLGKAEKLVPLLDDEDPELRLTAAENLLKLNPRYRSQVRKSLAHEEAVWVRQKMEILLQKSRR